jgi:hypothetical protein
MGLSSRNRRRARLKKPPGPCLQLNQAPAQDTRLTVLLAQTCPPPRLHPPVHLLMDPHELLWWRGPVLLPLRLRLGGRDIRHRGLQDVAGSSKNGGEAA